MVYTLGLMYHDVTVYFHYFYCVSALYKSDDTKFRQLSSVFYLPLALVNDFFE